MIRITRFRPWALGGVTACGVLALAAAVGTASPSAATAAPKILVKSTIALDTKTGTVTLPVFKGRTASGGAVWYIVTDSSSKADAARRGVEGPPGDAEAPQRLHARPTRLLPANGRIR